MVAPVVTAPMAEAIADFYARRANAPLWLAGGPQGEAAMVLVAILRRAPLDGLAAGPLLAAQVETAVGQARGGDPARVQEAERLLSAAWVLYVQAISSPVPGMIYARPVPMPDANRILRRAAAAPLLATHLQAVSSVNPLYAQLRDAAWGQVQQSGGGLPDSRLLANLSRARAMPLDGRYILVDAASARLWMYEDGKVRDSMRVIVGKSDHPTPMIASTIHYVTFNPYWNVPTELIRKTVAPNVLRLGLSYLRERGYEVVDGWSDTSPIIPPDQLDWKAIADGRKDVRVRQLPGGANSMGQMKFSFPSGQDIYLHDTPTKELFGKGQRTLSNGCIRLEDAPRLARWLLGREPVAASSAAELHTPLPKGVPVYVTYLTAEMTDGKLGFLEDVYGLDRKPQLVTQRSVR